MGTCDIYSITCHELAHASHFMQVGKDWWDKFIIYILTSYVSTGETYGNGSGENAGYCAVGEMWAYYMQNRMFNDRYGESCRWRALLIGSLRRSSGIWMNGE